jgi:HupE/UreJ protein
MRALIAIACAAGACAVLAPAGDARAHGMRSGAMRIEEIGETRALVHWRQSIPAEIEVEFPEDCRASDLEGGARAVERSYLVECARPLAGETFGVKGLGPIITDATLLVTFRDGSSVARVLLPDSPRFSVPRAEGALEVASAYVALGALHIASGADHLLFLFLLVVLLKTKLRAVLLAESGFTLSHSISFSLTALGLIEVAAPAAEACIALSLVLLALDAARGGDAENPRRAAWMALVFGSVHGLGFAGGLRELGLPTNHVATALAGFGVGVELGQIAFIGLIIAGLRVLFSTRIGPRAAAVSISVVGVLSTYWLIARLIVCLDV